MHSWYTGLVSESKRNPNTTCVTCGTPIYRRPGVLKQSHNKVYCSSVCYGISNRKENPCIVCGVLILAGSNKKTCSRSCANTNRAGIVYSGRRPKDKVVTARLLKARLVSIRGSRCERCDFSIIQVIQVHHRDRIREHNSLDNLELLCPNCHASEHYLKK